MANTKVIKIVIYPGLEPGYIRLKLGGESPFMDIKSEELDRFMVDYMISHNLEAIDIIDRTEP